MVRTGRPVRYRATLAYLELVSAPDSHPYFGAIRSGILRRAAELGFRVETHRLDPGSPKEQQKLQRTLLARGTAGIIAGPSDDPETDLSGLDWSQFTGVAIGFSIKTPRLNCVASHHFHSARRAIAELVASGFKRIGVILLENTHRRVDELFSAADALHQLSQPLRRRIPMLRLTEWERGAVMAWLRKNPPDALLVNSEAEVRELRECGLQIPGALAVAVLAATDPSGTLSGIDQRPVALGVAAAEMVIGQLLNNQRGIPEDPRTTLIEGLWVQGETLAGHAQ